MAIINVLKNKDTFDISQARNIITNEALARNTRETISYFESKCQEILKDYNSSPRLSLSSTSFQIDKLDSFKTWLEELRDTKNIHKYMPFIVSKMFDGDALAYSIFNAVWEGLGKNDLLFSANTFANHPELKIGVANSDAGVSTKAVLNAQHWVNSVEGKQVLCDNPIYKSDIEDLVGKCDE